MYGDKSVLLFALEEDDHWAFGFLRYSCVEMAHFLTYCGDLAQMVYPNISELCTTLKGAYMDLASVAPRALQGSSPVCQSHSLLDLEFNDVPPNEQFRLDGDSDTEGNVTLEHLCARSWRLVSIAHLTPPHLPAQVPENNTESDHDEQKLRPYAPNPALTKVLKKAPVKPKDKGKSVNRSSLISTGEHPHIQKFANAASVEPSEPDKLAASIPEVQEPDAGQKRKHATSEAKSDKPKKSSKGKKASKAEEPTKPLTRVVTVVFRSITNACQTELWRSVKLAPHKSTPTVRGSTMHSLIINSATPDGAIANASQALNSAIEQSMRASNRLAALAYHVHCPHLSSLVPAHYQFFGSVAIPDNLHNIPAQHLQEIYNMFLLSNTLKLDLPYLNAEEFMPLPIESERTVQWAEELLGYNVSPPSHHSTLPPNTCGEGGSRFPGAMDDPVA
ncbi:hypothetical protein DFH09DRAFT_1118974 [Mycena vulgaris]|nr:hypothetical protein DFH09DRAFT_1118974 [Mycena vulgaris]